MSTLRCVIALTLLAACGRKSQEGETCASTNDCANEGRCIESRCVSVVTLRGQKLMAGVYLYQLIHGELTRDNSTGLQALWVLERALPEIDEEDIKDPWGNYFIFGDPPIDGVYISSMGPDGKLHTEDDVKLKLSPIDGAKADTPLKERISRERKNQGW